MMATGRVLRVVPPLCGDKAGTSPPLFGDQAGTGAALDDVGNGVWTQFRPKWYLVKGFRHAELSDNSRDRP